MVVKIFSCLQQGIEGKLIEVEVDILQGLSAFSIVGLGDTAVQEAKERIRSAIKNSGAYYPRQKKIINLAPADIKKHGPHFDLPMAVGLLAASEQIKSTPLLVETLIVGELALDGTIKPINGAVSLALFAKKNGWKRLMLPSINLHETFFIEGIEIIGMDSLKNVRNFFNTGKKEETKILSLPSQSQEIFKIPYITFDDIYGHEYPKRALAIAAAGGHHVLFIGSPGVGKTLLAKALTNILPPLNEEEMFEVLQIYSAAGLLYKQKIEGKHLQRPFREVHSSCSLISLTGGGKFLRPGEISLAHRGVLFLDEIAEFPRQHLESLRQPLESKTINLSRAFGNVQYPAQFTLIASMNPCPCGFAKDQKRSCTCSSYQIIQYQKKLSGPLLDRIDLNIEVTKQELQEFGSNKRKQKNPHTQKTALIQNKVAAARKRQTNRLKDYKIITNTEMWPTIIKRFCILTNEGYSMMKEANEKLQLSGRQHHQILKIARTIADLEGHEKIELNDLAEAMQYRQKEFIVYQ